MARAARFLGPTSLLCVSLLGGIAGCGGGPDGSDGGPGPGTDASVDSAMDAAPACHGDMDCNDGLYCNGDEHCTGGACVAGTPPSCDDAIACTHDFCSEDRRACSHQVPDVDGDGHGDAACIDATRTPLGDDCADDDARRFPGNVELCDAAMHDEDCVATTFGNVDNDSDGFIDATCCNGASCGNDCDDSNRSVNPSGTEVCDHIDNDCDTHVDEMVGVMLYVDADRDGYGNSALDLMTECGDTVGFATLGGDCDDMRVDRNPGQLEVCDTIDNDCDIAVDENAGIVAWYVDVDHDGYGDPHGATLMQCAPPTGSYSLVGTDCDDTTSSRSPRAAEVCNGIDDDCNGLPDFAIAPGNLEDDDRDGVADIGCGLPRGLDCNDRDATALPGAPEICNGRDDDCDTRIDENATSATFHRDADMDGYGDPGTAVIACFAPTGFVTDATDCDDSVTGGGRHPGAVETCNASDDDCDHRIDETPAASSCSIAGAIAACTVGICHQAGCQPGFSDCTLAVGCETSTIADNARCGSCNHACDQIFEQCASSVCVPGGLRGVAGVSPRDDVGTAIAALGNFVVLGGSFSGNGFGVGCGSHFDAMSVAGIVSMRNSSGDCIANLAIDGIGDEVVTAVAVDASGVAYVALTTTSTTLSIGGMAVNGVTGQGQRDVVIARLEGSPFAATWAKRFGGTFDDTITDIALDGTDLWAVGAMRGPAAIGTMSLAAGTTTDSIAIHLSTAGVVQHVASGASTGGDGALAVAIDPDSVYIVGTASGTTAALGGTSVTVSGASDAYLWTLARADGTTTGARVFGGTGADAATGIALNDGVGAAIVITGTFEAAMTVGSTVLTSAGLRDGFVLGLPDATSAPDWLFKLGGAGDDVLTDIAFSPGFSHFVAVGSFSGMTTVGVIDAGTSSSGGTDGLMFGVTTDGYPSFPQTMGGLGNEHANSVATNGGSLVYVAGDYSSQWSSGGAAFPALGGTDASWLFTYFPGT